MFKTIIQTLYEYNFALDKKVWESILTLPNEQFLLAVDYSRGSLRDQMLHMTSTYRRWLAGLCGEAPGSHLNSQGFPDASSVYQLWEEISQDWIKYINKLDESAIEKNIPGMPGARWQVIFHVANHGTDHRAQVLRILHDLGAPTFDQDFILYLWDPIRKS